MTLANPKTDFGLTPTAELPELLAWDEICRRYPNEWVLLVAPVYRDFIIDGGRVYAHNRDKHALVPAGHTAARLYGHIGRFYTGLQLIHRENPSGCPA